VVPAVDSEDLQHFLAAGYPSLGEATSTPCAAGAYEFKLKGIKPAEKRRARTAILATLSIQLSMLLPSPDRTGSRWEGPTL
jgi:hypothetical protein